MFYPTTDGVEIIVDSKSSVNGGNCSNEVPFVCETFDHGMKLFLTFCERSMMLQDYEKILTVMEGNYNFTSAEVGHFNSVNNLTIKGNSSIITCSHGVGFSFINSSNITIKGLVFMHCGQIQNSTSLNQSSNEFISTIVTMYFLYCKGIVMMNVTVSDTEGTAVIFYNIVGNNIIEYSNFERNKFNNVPGGGGIYIEYSFCVPPDDAKKCLQNNSESNVVTAYTLKANFIIKDCIFIDNFAYFPANNELHLYTYLVSAGRLHSAFGSGGGLSVYFMGKSSMNNIYITRCQFLDNVALWGGGLFIQFQDSVINNNVTVVDSNFNNNSVFYHKTTDDGTAGGGSRLALFFYEKNHTAKKNNVTYFKCTFQRNKAYFGGGLSFYSSLWNEWNTIKLQDCSFENNTARIGSAADFTVQQLIAEQNQARKTVMPTIVMSSCNFTNNSARSSSDGLIGIGAVNLYGVNVLTMQKVLFVSNIGSGLSIIFSMFKVSDDGTVAFHENKGRNGGAIAIFGTALIVVGKYSKMEFTENNADYLGGAIYHTGLGIYHLIYSRFCFIQYGQQDTPNFVFTNNKANNKSNSIYASTLLPCLRDVSLGDYNENIFCRNNTFVYNYDQHNESCHTQITIAPSEINIDTSKPNLAIPGQYPIKINYKVESNTNYNITNQNPLIVAIDTIPSQHDASSAIFPSNKESRFSYISNHNLYLTGKENTNVSLTLETTDPIAIRRQISVKFQKCPPGFQFNNKKHICDCAGDYNKQLICDQRNFRAKLLRTSWIGPKPNADSDELFVAFSPYVMRTTLDESILLPPVFDLDMLNKDLCGKLNRKGALCGECMSGYGVSVNTNDYRCVKCNAQSQNYNWLYYVVSEFVPVTVFSVFVFLFSNIITHGPMNSFIFFSQIITSTVQMNAYGLTPIRKTVKNFDIFQDIYMIPYDFWNLKFFHSTFHGFCLSPNLGTLAVLMLGYVTALYPLLIVVVIMFFLNLYNRGVRGVVAFVRPIHYCLARFKQLTTLKFSATSGMAVFILMSYHKFACVSFNLIPFYHLYDAEGNQNEAVFYHQGSTLFPEEGILYFITAIIVLSTFGIIPPIILVYPSLLKLLEWCRCIRSCVQIEKYYPTSKVQAFLDEFHGCYKNGNENGKLDCRWFASFYFSLRIFLLLVFSQTNTWQQLYLSQSMIFLFCTILFALIRPYREDWINNVDTCIFGILSTVSTISLYNLQKARIQDNISVMAFLVQFALMMVPLIYCIVYYSLLLYKWSKEKYYGYLNSRETVNVNVYCQDEEEQQSLDDSSMYATRFLEFIRNSGRYREKEPLRLSTSSSENYGTLSLAND